MRKAVGIAAVVLAVLVTGVHGSGPAALDGSLRAGPTTVDDLHLTSAPALTALPGPRARPDQRPTLIVLLVVAVALAATVAVRRRHDDAAAAIPAPPPPPALRRRGPPQPA